MARRLSDERIPLVVRAGCQYRCGDVCPACCWGVFIFPAVEAISMVRYYKAIAREYPDVKLKGFFRMFAGCYEPFGRSFESMRCAYGYWDGVGKWRVYNNEDSDK